MMRQAGFGVVLFLAAMAGGFAQPAHAQKAPQPWISAEKILKETEADIQKSGLKAIESHRDDMEKALAEGAKASPLTPDKDGTITLLTDGATETMSLMAAAAYSQKKVAIRINPYPRLGLYLGIYYNEIDKPDEAVRTITAALNLESVTGQSVGAHLPALYSEQAVGFGRLMRWSDALAASDTGLKLKLTTPRDKARLHRARGSALIELARLDEAESAYKASQKLEDHPQARERLEHIQRLRAQAAPPDMPLSAM